MTPAGQKQFRVFVASTKLSLSRASCAAAVSALVAQAIREFGGRFGPASFPRFTVHGDVALSVKNASRLPLRLAKTSSGWKVDSLSMAPLTRPGEIPAFDADKIAAAHVDLARYCLQSLKSTTTPASQRSYLHALETYIRYYREAPRKAVSPIAHKTMRQLLTDEASALDGCGLTDDANELDRVLRFG